MTAAKFTFGTTYPASALVAALLLLAVGAVPGTTAWGASANLWDEQVNGTLSANPYAPTNYEYVTHSIGIAADDINYVSGTVLLAPDGLNFYAEDDAFSFIVPAGRQLAGLLLTETNTYSTTTWGGLYASATGPSDGTGQIGTWFAPDVLGTNDVFASLGLGLSSLPGGIYSLNIIPFPGVNNGSLLPGPDTVHYTLAILTAPMPAPSLQISRIGFGLGSELKLSWATNGAYWSWNLYPEIITNASSISFVLQSTTNLNPASISTSSWNTLTNAASIIDTNFVTVTPMLYDRQYFRLLLQTHIH